MATVIDALVITLGLDPKGMQKGGKDAAEALDKTKDKAEKTGKDIAESGEKSAEFFNKMTKGALSFFAVFTAGKTLKAFVADTVASNAGLQRTSRRLNMATKDVYALQKAVESVGGSGDAVAASLQNIQTAMTDPEQAARLTKIFSQLGVSEGIDINTGQITDINKFYQNLAENRTKLANAPRVGLLQDAGLDQGSIDLILKGEGAVKSTFSTYEELGKKIEKNAKESEKLQAKYKELTEQNKVYAQELEGDLLPALTSVTGALSDFEKQNPELARGVIIATAAIAGMGTALGGIMALVGGIRFLRVLGRIERLAAATGKASGAKEIAKGAQAAEKVAEEGAAEATTAKGASSVAGVAAETGAAAASGAASKAASTISGNGAQAERGAGKATGELKEVPAIVQKAPRAARIARIASRALGGLSVASDAYLAGDIFWNGAEPALSKNDTTDTPKKLYLKQLEQQYNLPAGLLDAMWAKESSRGKNAGASSAGALGDFQIMPDVAKEAGIDPKNFEQSARYAAKRMHDSMQKYNGSLAASLADYNWGGGNLRRDMSRNGEEWQDHAPNETQDYISSISRAVAMTRDIPERGAYQTAQTTNYNSVNVAEIKVVSSNPAQAGEAVRKKIVEMRVAASNANSGIG